MVGSESWLANIPPDSLTESDWRAIVAQQAAGDNRGMLLVDRERIVLAISARARELLGHTSRIPASAREVMRHVGLDSALEEAFHDRHPVHGEVYFPDPDRLLAFYVVPILRRTGVPVPHLVAVTVEDITRLRHLETVRRDFVANVSHELRTPIASIALMTETLQSGAMMDREAATRFLHRIEVEVQSMRLLVDELLELSRLESGRLTLDLAPVDVGSMLGAVGSRLAPATGAKSVVLRLDVPRDLPLVTADARRLEQVLINLVDNAVKFTPEGGVVSLRAGQQGRGVQVEVTDTGVGIDPREAGRIFERFYKVGKGRSRTEGAGLGLAIAHHLLQLHGSQLRVVSLPGHGSRFSFGLPVTEADALRD